MNSDNDFLADLTKKEIKELILIKNTLDKARKKREQEEQNKRETYKRFRALLEKNKINNVLKCVNCASKMPQVCLKCASTVP